VLMRSPTSLLHNLCRRRGTAPFIDKLLDGTIRSISREYWGKYVATYLSMSIMARRYFLLSFE
jgi:hypothetical protein